MKKEYIAPDSRVIIIKKLRCCSEVIKSELQMLDLKQALVKTMLMRATKH